MQEQGLGSVKYETLSPTTKRKRSTDTASKLLTQSEIALAAAEKIPSVAEAAESVKIEISADQLSKEDAEAQYAPTSTVSNLGQSPTAVPVRQDFGNKPSKAQRLDLLDSFPNSRVQEDDKPQSELLSTLLASPPARKARSQSQASTGESHPTTLIEKDTSRESLSFSAVKFDKPITPDKKRPDLCGQDRGFVNESRGIAFVADGHMHATGTRVAEIVSDYFEQSTSSTSFDGLSDSDMKHTVERVIKDSIEAVKQGRSKGEVLGGAGCTVAGMIPFVNEKGDQKLASFGVGDSAVLRVRNGKVERLTREEDMAAEGFAATGYYDRRIANRITNRISGLGGQHNDEVKDDTVVITDVQPGDRLVVTTDGIEELYTDEENYPAIPAKFNKLMELSQTDVKQTLEKMADDSNPSQPNFTKPDDRLAFIVDARL